MPSGRLAFPFQKESAPRASGPRGSGQKMLDYPKPPFPKQRQPMPGLTPKLQPVPDHGERTYKGAGRLAGRKAIITGGDSGIGRAVALAFAREGADVLISYLDEHEDAGETRRLVEEAGRTGVLVAGDIQDPKHCRAIVDRAVEKLGAIDILVNNAAHQASCKEIEDISDDEWELTFRVNIHAMFYLTKAAVPHMKPGSAIINTASINSDVPNPTLLAYATTKGAIHNFTAGLAQLLAKKGIRANAMAPGRSGRRSFHRRFPRIRSSILESRCRCSGRDSRPSSQRHLSCSPTRCRATCRERP
jgi:NAD(P)-dependent dehydrogenase (short-subunit alcohol dehydrogenase family)